MRRAHLLPFLVLALAGCGAGWHRVETTPDATVDPRTQYLVYHAGAADRWHALRVTADSVSGVPWLAPVECDSCRVTLASVAVDSLKEGHPVAGLWKGYGLVMFGPFLLLSAICIVTGDPAGCWIPPST